MKRPGFQPKFIFGRPNPHATDPEPAHNSNLRNTSVSDIAGSFVSSDHLEEARSLYGDNIRPFYIPVSEGVSRVIYDLSDIGNPLIVGGTVRDSLRGQHNDINDIDIEVHETNVDEITDHMRDRGYMVDEVGKQFGVLKVHKKGVVDDLDISVPRRENRTGAGHRSFDVDMDENMSVEEASERRDFTINAIMYDPELQVLVDHHGGVEDLSSGTLRHVSDKFSEDPLRVLRGFQFAGRFGMSYDPETAELCHSIRDQYRDLSVERVQGEWYKFYRQSTDHNAGIAALQDSGWDDTIPGLRQVLDAPDMSVKMTLLSTLRDPKDRIICGSTVLASGMNEHDREEFLKHTVIGKEDRRLTLSMIEVSKRNLDTPFDRKQTASEFAHAGFTFTQYDKIAMVMCNREHSQNVSKAFTEGLSDGPEPDLINGKDILDMTDHGSGKWIGDTLRHFRTRQYQGEFQSRDQALRSLSEFFEN